uniref:Uncharacterized protein n=1 Tax=Arundo donax TaxID=35708 RepID=A0A0A8Y232_ARUDO
MEYICLGDEDMGEFGAKGFRGNGR